MYQDEPNMSKTYKTPEQIPDEFIKALEKMVMRQFLDDLESDNTFKTSVELSCIDPSYMSNKIIEKAQNLIDDKEN